MQCDRDTETIQVFGFDGTNLVYNCTIWLGEVSWTAIQDGYTQEQNDADLADFEAHCEVLCNQSATPKGSDGTPAVLPCLFPNGVYLYLGGSGDTEAGRGAGAPFVLSKDTTGDLSTTWSYNDWVLIAGGGLSYKEGQPGDYATLEILAPATPVVPNAENQGNCNLIDPGIGAAILIVPAAGNGAFDVDLSQAAPVPAWNTITGVGSGFYEWDKPPTGKGTISIGLPQAAHFNLFAIEIPLVRFINKLSLLGDGVLNFNTSAIEPKLILPHWQCKGTIHNNGHEGLVCSWYLTLARSQTI